jgi:hypothetical protein
MKALPDLQVVEEQQRWLGAGVFARHDAILAACGALPRRQRAKAAVLRVVL